jgi:hypothetical protein
MTDAPLKAFPRFVEQTETGITIKAPDRLFHKGSLAYRWSDAGRNTLILEKKPGQERKVTGAAVEGNTLYVSSEPVKRPRFSFGPLSFGGGRAAEMFCFNNDSEARIAYAQLRDAYPHLTHSGF